MYVKGIRPYLAPLFRGKSLAIVMRRVSKYGNVVVVVVDVVVVVQTPWCSPLLK